MSTPSTTSTEFSSSGSRHAFPPSELGGHPSVDSVSSTVKIIDKKHDFSYITDPRDKYTRIMLANGYNAIERFGPLLWDHLRNYHKRFPNGFWANNDPLLYAIVDQFAADEIIPPEHNDTCSHAFILAKLIHLSACGYDQLEAEYLKFAENRALADIEFAANGYVKKPKTPEELEADKKSQLEYRRTCIRHLFVNEVLSETEQKMLEKINADVDEYMNTVQDDEPYDETHQIPGGVADKDWHLKKEK
jgi:hypothetical protein